MFKGVKFVWNASRFSILSATQNAYKNIPCLNTLQNNGTSIIKNWRKWTGLRWIHHPKGIFKS